MRNIISKIGPIFTVALITVGSSLLSSLLTFIVVFLIKHGLVSDIGQKIDYHTAVPIAFVIPFLVSPIVLWHLVKLVIEIHNLEEEMRHAATTDALTTLLNRHAFRELAHKQLQQAIAQRLFFTLIVVDLDYFKHINDRYGHAGGDEVLRCFGYVARQMVRKTDLIGRLGGEEFAFFLLGVDQQQSRVFAECLHKALKTHNVVHEGRRIEYTASIGVLSQQANHLSEIEMIMLSADKALYRAKALGRNQTFYVE